MNPVSPIDTYSTLPGATPPPPSPKPDKSTSDNKDTPPSAEKDDSKGNGVNIVV
jgi:hypothetical protein